MKELLRSTTTRTVLITVGVAAVLLLVFGLGIAVGYRHAIFASRFGENYYRNFGAAPQGMLSDGSGPFNTHGVVGTVLDVASTSLSVKDADNDERSIGVFPDTVFREMNMTIGVDAVHAGDRVTVIGSPDASGRIRARFIRVFADPDRDGQ